MQRARGALLPSTQTLSARRGPGAETACAPARSAGAEREEGRRGEGACPPRSNPLSLGLVNQLRSVAALCVQFSLGALFVRTTEGHFSVGRSRDTVLYNCRRSRGSFLFITIEGQSSVERSRGIFRPCDIEAVFFRTIEGHFSVGSRDTFLYKCRTI